MREGWRDKGREGGKGRRQGESKYVVVWVNETMHQLIHSTILSHRHTQDYKHCCGSIFPYTSRVTNINHSHI